MDSYNTQTSHGFFLNCLFNSRIDIGVDSEDQDDNFLNAYLAGVLASRINRDVSPTRAKEIHEIVSSKTGDRERIMRLQMAADRGLIFHSLFQEDTKDYDNVGIAYISAASICDKLGDPIGEIFSYLDQNLELCVDLLFHVKTNYLTLGNRLTETEVYRMTLPQDPESALDAFLGYYGMWINETDPEKRKTLTFHLQETKKIAQELNPQIVFPEIN